MFDFAEFGPPGEAREKGEALVTLPQAHIRPDPDQPRRLLPSDLAQALIQGKMQPAQVMQEWMQRAGEEGASPALKRTMRSLRRLADSIERQGLINPITVRTALEDETMPAGAGYLIITGERRYWAHVLLAASSRQIQEGDEVRDPSHIKAIVAARGVNVRAHQIVENLAREDLNVIERAQGLCALRRELSNVGGTHGLPSGLGAAGDGKDQDTHGLPLVPWVKVQELLGISKQHRIRITSALDLCDEAQGIVAAHNLTEHTIRPIIQKLKDRPDLQVEALKRVVAWQGEPEGDGNGERQPITTSVQDLVDQLLDRETPAEKAKESVDQAAKVITHQPGVRRLHRRVRDVNRDLDRMWRDEDGLNDVVYDLATVGEMAEVMDDIRTVHVRLGQVIEMVEGHQAGGAPPRNLG